jgi:hypothetical protein
MSSNPFTSAKVAPAYTAGHFVYWSIDPTFNEEGPHNFTVEVSGTPDFSEIEYSIPAGNAFSITDPAIKFKQSFALDLFYRIKLTTGDDNTYFSPTVTFSVSSYNRREWVASREIVRKELLRIKKFTGRSMWLLKRKVYGKQLNDPKIDPVTGVPLTNEAPDQGSRFVNGYYQPLGLYCSIEDVNSSRTNSQSGLGVEELIQQKFRTVGFPVIQTYDIIVDANNDERYNVKEVETFNFPSTDIMLVQLVTAQLIPNTSPVYKIDIPNVPYI